MKLLLDTNAYAGFKLGYNGIVEYMTRANNILISPIMLGELLFGFRSGTRFDKNIQELNEFLAHRAVEIIQVTAVTSDRYARITSQLKIQGTPIPSNDIWIAAQTMETGAELLTMDHHFKNISGLVYRLFDRPA